LVAEATLSDDDRSAPEGRGHLTPRSAGRLAALAGAEKLILTHLWSERTDDEVIRGAADSFAGQIQVAHPGLHVDV